MVCTIDRVKGNAGKKRQQGLVEKAPFDLLEGACLGDWRAKFVCAIQPRFVFMDAAKMAAVIASELHVVCMNVVSFVHPNAIGVCLSSSFKMMLS